jgi:hypothetical protein
MSEKDFGSHTHREDGVIIPNYISGASSGISTADQALILKESSGGLEFTGGFEDRTTGNSGSSDLGSNVQYTVAQAAAKTWRRFGFSTARQVANDNQYWGETDPAFDQSKGLFGGLQMPSGVTDLFDFNDTSFGDAVTTGNNPHTAANGSYDLSQCNKGDLVNIRFSFNCVPQHANTTMEVGLIWATRDADDNVTFTFPLTTQPIFFGTGTQGVANLNRVEMTAYLASDEDLNARALPAIRANNEILIQPLSTLITIIR